MFGKNFAKRGIFYDDLQLLYVKHLKIHCKNSSINAIFLKIATKMDILTLYVQKNIIIIPRTLFSTFGMIPSLLLSRPLPSFLLMYPSFLIPHQSSLNSNPFPSFHTLNLTYIRFLVPPQPLVLTPLLSFLLPYAFKKNVSILVDQIILLGKLYVKTNVAKFCENQLFYYREMSRNSK